MRSFAELTAQLRAVFAFWALLLCLMNIGSAALAAVKKRGRFTVLAALLFAPVYFLWQAIFDLSLFGGTEYAAKLPLALGGSPWAVWLACFALLTLGSALLLGYDLHYDKNYITPGTIKLYLDQLPCGVCCWRDSGRVLFSNVCMSRLCEKLTNGPLLNGNSFREAVSGGILTVEDRVWRFSCRVFTLDGERLNEMIASDITSEYVKTQALERDKAELSSLNRELREYYLSMDDVIRRQEILQAKANIHDEMNRLMLSTTAASAADTAALDRIFSLWEQNALLLCMEAEEKTDEKTRSSLDKLAQALDVRLIWQDALPGALREPQRRVFYSAAREAVVNAVKHAEAKTVTISFRETEDRLFCRFTNDGAVPKGPVRFTGGLANLALLADRQGVSVSASCEQGFALSLCFPKNAETHQPIG